jgi:hypothetical protein
MLPIQHIDLTLANKFSIARNRKYAKEFAVAGNLAIYISRSLLSSFNGLHLRTHPMRCLCYIVHAVERFQTGT